MNWAQPAWLALLPLVGLLGVLLRISARRHRSRLARLFEGDLLEQVLPRAIRFRRAVRDVASLLGLALAIVALAEPRFDKEIRSVEAKGTDLVLLVDLSRSMDAQDVDPSRLERARREIADLVRVIEGDRVGLVVYAAGAYARMPMTVDYHALLSVVDELRSDTFSAQGSALGDGIRVSLEVLSRTTDQAGQAIIVLSDGETHDPEDARAAAADAADRGVTIYTMGIGEETALVPDPSGWLVWRGEQVLTTPDEGLLKDIARATGGAFVHSVSSPADIADLYRGEIRGRLRAATRSVDQREVWKSAFQWPLGLGLALLLLGAWLGDGRRPWGQTA